MKTNFKIYFLVVLSSLLSCSLEETILNVNMSDTFIKKESDVIDLLKGVYANNATYNLWKSNFPYIYNFGGDDFGPGLTSYFLSFHNRTVPTTSNYHRSWQEFYTQIVRTNSVMNAIKTTSATLSDSLKNRAIAECHFIRAFNYFYLVRVYGGVPIRTEVTTGKSDFYLPRNTVDEVYALIFEDFKIATEGCIPYSQQPINEWGHGNKGAAQAMLSLAYLTYANQLDLQNKNTEARSYYQLAKDYADSVLLSNEYILLDNFKDLWKVKTVNDERNAYKEVIFGIMMTRDATRASASSSGSEFAGYYQPSTRYLVSGNVAFGRGANQGRLQPWFYDIYSTGEYVDDYRSNVSFLLRWPNSGSATQDRITYPLVRTAGNEVVEQYPFLDKYQDPDGYQQRNNENDLFIIRLSEVYLIKAEAENELNGPTAIAYEAFNKLRERARKADGNPRTTPPDLEPGLSKEEFRLKIFTERGLEFVGEGKRWFDSIRMRYIDNQQTMIQYRYEVFYPAMDPKSPPSYNTTTNTWGGGKVNLTSIVPFSGKLLLWPIPSNEMDANPNMTQNPDW